MNLSVGQQATKEMTVSEAMVRSYAELTGDFNPLHFDADFAGRTRFERLIAQGGITTGLLHALVAMDMPGPGSDFVRQQWSFPRPVYIGDTLRAQATVKSVRAGRNLAEREFLIVNQRGEEVLEGQTTVHQADSQA